MRILLLLLLSCQACGPIPSGVEFVIRPDDGFWYVEADAMHSSINVTGGVYLGHSGGMSYLRVPFVTDLDHITTVICTVDEQLISQGYSVAGSAALDHARVYLFLDGVSVEPYSIGPNARANVNCYIGEI